MRSSWMLGRVVAAPALLPLVYRLSADRPGTPRHLYEEHFVPAMSGALKLALERVGVSNIQYFPAVLHDPVDGTDLVDYWAFNVVGLIACADMARSSLMGTSDSRMGDIDFDALVIDETKTGNLPIFRLAESISAIVVNERVRTAVLAAGIPGMVFYESGTWSG
jgi:hypothetical protein